MGHYWSEMQPDVAVEVAAGCGCSCHRTRLTCCERCNPKLDVPTRADDPVVWAVVVDGITQRLYASEMLAKSEAWGLREMYIERDLASQIPLLGVVKWSVHTQAEGWA